jgi:diguanylate cyclase (GGDEF)-like protein/PAS domain S-box-containing protein
MMTAMPEVAGDALSRVVAFPARTIEDDSRFLHTVLENIADGVYVVDLDRRIVFWNRAAEELTGYGRDEVLGRRCADGILRHCDGDGSILCKTGCPLKATMEDGRNREAQVFMLHRDGQRVPVIVKSAPMRDRLGRIVGSVEIFGDNRHRLAAVDEIRQLREKALIDPLTEIGNRRFIETQIRILAGHPAGLGWPFAVLFADIDHFKSINDRFGHAIGDDALRVVAKTLSGGLRSLDLIGRWGGEEFVVVATNVDDSTLAQLAERLRALVAAAVVPVGNGDAINVTCSVGGTIARAGETADDVIARADHYMYQSKANGRDRVTIGQEGVVR